MQKPKPKETPKVPGMEQKEKKDEYLRIIDYLPEGKAEMPMHKRKPIAQGIGENYFSLLEVVPRRGMSFESGERVYIGDETREKVDHIERRIKYEWLTPTAKSELPFILEEAITDNEKYFIQFYNTAGAISVRQHKLERLPRIGKKHVKDILGEREKKPFESYEDLKNRVKSMPDPAKVLSDAIVNELKGESKYRLFVPVIKEERPGRRKDTERMPRERDRGRGRRY